MTFKKNTQYRTRGGYTATVGAVYQGRKRRAYPVTGHVIVGGRIYPMCWTDQGLRIPKLKDPMDLVEEIT